MRQIVELPSFWILLAIATLLISLEWGQVGLTPAQAEVIPATAGSGGLITHIEQSAAGDVTRVIMIDPQLRRMAVYDVPANGGAIQLKSVRNLTVDLQLQSFNSEDPSPIDMEKMLQRN
jgi:hypothetical protein